MVRLCMSSEVSITDSSTCGKCETCAEVSATALKLLYLLHPARPPHEIRLVNMWHARSRTCSQSLVESCGVVATHHGLLIRLVRIAM